MSKKRVAGGKIEGVFEQFKKDVTKLQAELNSWLGYIDVTENYTEEE